MPQKCSICISEHRSEIEVALREKVPLRDIASRFGTTTGSLGRHKQKCLNMETVKAVLEAVPPREPLPALEEPPIARHLTIYDAMIDLRDKAEKIYNLAEKDGNHQAMAAALREIRGVVMDMAKLSLVAHKREEKKTKTELSDTLKEMLERLNDS